MTHVKAILFVIGANPDDSVSGIPEQRGLTVTTVADCEAAFQRLIDLRFDLVVIDLDRTDDGADFIKRVRSNPSLKSIPILVAGEWGTGRASLALSFGADAFEPMPIDSARLVESVERLLNGRAAVATSSE